MCIFVVFGEHITVVCGVRICYLEIKVMLQLHGVVIVLVMVIVVESVRVVIVVKVVIVAIVVVVIIVTK